MTKAIFAASDTIRFGKLKSYGEYNWLVSYWYAKNFKGDTYREKILNMGWQPGPNGDNHFFLDSGAFSAWSKGVVITLDEYIDFCLQTQDLFTNIVALDVIADPVASEFNHRKMLEAGIKNLIPVFHGGEPYSVLEMLLDKGYPYIGVAGGAHGLTVREKIEIVNDIWSKYGDRLDKIKTHGFGYLDARSLQHMNLTTADSTSWLMQSIYGKVRTPYGDYTTSSRSPDSPQHIMNVTGRTRDLVVEWLKQFPFTLEELDDWEKRCKVNWFFYRNVVEPVTGKPKGYIEPIFKDDTGFGYSKQFTHEAISNYVPPIPEAKKGNAVKKKRGGKKKPLGNQIVFVEPTEPTVEDDF